MFLPIGFFIEIKPGKGLILCRTTVQWMFWGYTLAYSRDGGPFIGTLQTFGLKNVLVALSPGSDVLPEIVFCYFQLLFCACTVRPSHPILVMSVTGTVP